MKQIIPCYKNWRIDVLLIIAAVALILFTSNGRTAFATLLIKFMGIVLAAIDICLYRFWNRHNSLEELKNITED